MIGILTILLALPLGYLMHSWLATSLTYAIVYLWGFVFQTLYLLLPSIDGTTGQTFEATTFPLDYGLVTATIFGVGFALVALGHRLRGRRALRRPLPA